MMKISVRLTPNTTRSNSNRVTLLDDAEHVSRRYKVEMGTEPNRNKIETNSIELYGLGSSLGLSLPVLLLFKYSIVFKYYLNNLDVFNRLFKIV